MPNIEVYKTVESLQQRIQQIKASNAKIGFVPTMGALHEGHASLMRRADEECDFVVASVFVNPTQFNNAEDLAKYPRTEDADIALLEQNHVDAVFMPDVQEIYPADYKAPVIALDALAEVMEGKFRPGHFEGVVEVVYRLFDIVQPDQAFFGDKDFQQLAIIRYMVNYFKLPIQIDGCPIIREEGGLAMSSRNMRLSEQGKKDALAIYKTLQLAKVWSSKYTPKDTMELIRKAFDISPLELEYFEIVNPNSLQLLTNDWMKGSRACIVAYCEGVRLIDNLELV